MKIAITGATGFVGTRLVNRLKDEDHQFVIFTRNVNRAKTIYPASTFPTVEIVPYNAKESGEWQDKISGCNAVVNLAGEPIAERWSPEHKKAILESRQLGTRKIVEAITKAKDKPSVLINPSAVGYYGTSETKTFDENSPPGNDFLAEVCQAWESEAQEVKKANVRLVILRFGIVLGKGGALARMIPPFKLFAGGPIGSGRQWFSWIHIDDLVELIKESLKRSGIVGTFNATSPNPVRMNELCETLGEVMNRPSWLPVPDFALEVILGEGSKLVLEGQQVLPKETLALGFQYQYPTIKSALMDIVPKM
ncbi:putative YfcH-like cell division inhibitor [Crocosphaera subtropica ATCC 51142]|uniref:YfcH-like cell division inhibitor n=1 Tax=Crocosphaera subtropica (strain ATCC 51142 / BH68) TaxID=43989 RepID=B1WYZ0_CROS5|nr:TIGR01777 family oxidoreductase [Crocosphaera subtropica]ACB52754.1 putative YfcH-like cell division inhibitor [Crocosphaera subtropica ATCC 51142]